MSAGIPKNRTGLNILAAATAVVIEGGDKGSGLGAPTTNDCRTLRKTEQISTSMPSGSNTNFDSTQSEFLYNTFFAGAAKHLCHTRSGEVQHGNTRGPHADWQFAPYDFLH